MVNLGDVYSLALDTPVAGAVASLSALPHGVHEGTDLIVPFLELGGFFTAWDATFVSILDVERLDHVPELFGEGWWEHLIHVAPGGRVATKVAERRDTSCLKELVEGCLVFVEFVVRVRLLLRS